MKPNGRDLEGRGVVVVGASSGIGRVFARRAIERGADVVVSARRGDRLVALRDECGAGTCVTADIASPDGPEAIAAAARSLPSVDLVFVVAGLAPLRPLAEHSPDDWTHTLAVNTVGVSRVFAALLPHLADHAIVGACSSDMVGRPRWGMGSYAASKAALEETIRAWRAEHPGVRFSTVVVGATSPTGFGRDFDAPMMERAFAHWGAQGHAQASMMATDSVGEVALDVLTSMLGHPSVAIEEVVLRSPSEAVPEMTV